MPNADLARFLDLARPQEYRDPAADPPPRRETRKGRMLRVACGADADIPDHLFVPRPLVVYYGCTPWVPSRDIDYLAQNPLTGAWQPPRRNYGRKDLCSWCGGCPAAAGQMCPGCHVMANPDHEERLKRLRARAALFRKNGVPLERPNDGTEATPEGPIPPE